jgi:lysyl endopeptidase
VGVSRDVMATKAAEQTLQQLKWTTAANGTRVAAISFTAQGAHGLRLGVVAKQLAPGTLMRVYSQTNPGNVFQISGQEVLQRIQLNAQAGDTSQNGQTWWTPDLGSDEVTLEVELPPGVSEDAMDISVPRVSHIFENLSVPTEGELTAKINESASCQLDATCYDAYANQRNAVARMMFTSDGNSYVCTGTLLNDSQSSGITYFLTANHCIATQSQATSLQTDWFYRAPTCNSRTLSNATTKRVNGAALLYASSSTDTALLKLNDTPPAGAYFAGWDATAADTGLSVVGLHHPRGDLLKFSMGTLSGQTACFPTSETQFSCGGTTGNYYRVTWSQGTTEGGSSGSALFKGGSQVIGTLYGGSSSCTATTSPEYYGRFDVAFNAALKNWLSPSTGQPPVVSTGNRAPVYRFYNGTTGAHFFTASPAERDNILKNLPVFAYEGVAFYAQAIALTGNSPVYRFYGSKGGAHFYTINAAERDAVVANNPEFKYEGVAWFANTSAAAGGTPLYRFYQPAKGVHFYTISAAERDYLIANSPSYKYEGIGYYAWMGL